MAYSGRCNGVAVNDFEGLVQGGVEGGEHVLVVTDVILGAGVHTETVVKGWARHATGHSFAFQVVLEGYATASCEGDVGDNEPEEH